MNSFVLFPQALEPSMNFNISKIVYSAIHYLSAPILYLVCTSKFCITFVFNFFWVLQSFKEKKKTFTGIMKKFKILWGQTRCIMHDVKIAKDL